MIQTPLRLDPETHAQVRARAVTHNTSFNAQAALLIEWGLEAEKESD